MTTLAQQRINFIALLHEVFFVKKGYGALAYVSITDVMTLFDEYLKSGKSDYRFINQYVRSFSYPDSTVNNGV